MRIVVAVIFLQTLFFKFTAAEESVYIFSTLGVEPWGRIGSGIFELAASALLLIPATAAIGALMALAATGSAVLLHLSKLGVVLAPVGDHGELFALAIVVVLCSAVILRLHRKELPLLGRMRFRKDVSSAFRDVLESAGRTRAASSGMRQLSDSSRRSRMPAANGGRARGTHPEN